VAKKLSNIKADIESKNIQFYEYFYSHIDIDIKQFVTKLLEYTNLYIFSGIIRDFFMSKKKESFRDIDLVIEEDLILENIFENLNYKKNSFGGYKLKFKDVDVDLWVIKKTWALNQGQLKLEFDYLNELPNTTFFNFSSILYSLNNKEFKIGIDFLRFIRDRKIELVLENNPYPELCIINSFYYSDKLGLKLGLKLKKYLILNYKEKDFEYVQTRHFGKIIYSNKLIEKRIKRIIPTVNIV
jgi:hypothetical protein